MQAVYELREGVVLKFLAYDLSIEEQLNYQGFTLHKTISFYETLCYALRAGFISGLITAAEFERITKRVSKDINTFMIPLKEAEND